MIVSGNIQNSHVFDSFSDFNQERSTALYVNNEIKDEVKFTATKDKKPSNKGKIILGSTLATSIVSAGILGMVLSRGIHGTSMKGLSKIASKLSREIHNSSLFNSADKLEKTSLFMKKGVKRSIDTVQSTSNFTAIKDWICDRLFQTNKVTAKFANKSRSGFKSIVDSTLSKRYDKVSIKVKNLSSLVQQYSIGTITTLDETQKMQQVTIKGVTRTLGEWAEILAKKSCTLENLYDEGFSLGARKARGLKRSGLLADVSDKIKERFFTKKGLFKLSNYKKYVTENVTSAAKKELQRDITAARKGVTNNMSSINDEIRGMVGEFFQTLDPKDDASAKMAQALKKSMDGLKEAAKTPEKKDKAVAEVSKTIGDIIIELKNNLRYTKEVRQPMIEQLEKIRTAVSSDSTYSKGALEEIMTILTELNSQTLGTTGKKIISDADMKTFSKLSTSIRSGLTKAAEVEMDEYFLKQAELEVGSAATDVLSVLFPIVAGSCAIAKGDDKDEKISAALTTCIPLVGTFATFVYGTTKMFSGAKNLGLSLVSGIVLNKIGKYCDKLYKKYKDSGSVVEVAKGEYDNFITDITPSFATDIELK